MMYKKERPGYLLGGLLTRPIKGIFGAYVRNNPMYRTVVKDLKSGMATKADKVRTGITGIRAYANALYKQTRKTLKETKDPEKIKQGKALLKELGDSIVRLKKSASKHKAAEVAEGLKKAGRKPNFKGGLIRKPKLAKRGF